MRLTRKQKLEKAIHEMASLQPGDSEARHLEAEGILLNYLSSIGDSVLVNAFEDARKRCKFYYA